jgi:lipopolysaccharide transport system permease protein
MFSPVLLWELTKRDFRERYTGSLLGSLWAIIWPLVNISIYIIIFGKMMGARLPGKSNVYAYGIYVAAGLFPWAALASSISRSTSVFLDKKHLISKIKISLPSLLLYINLSETITFLISMFLLYVFLLLNDFSFNQNLLLLPFIYYLQLLFAFGFGLMAATLTVFIRDIKEFVGVILQLWFWFTPIVYVPEILPDFVRRLMIYNPAYVIVDAYHHLFVLGGDPPYTSLIVLTIITHLIICGSYVLFRTLEKDVRDFL